MIATKKKKFKFGLSEKATRLKCILPNLRPVRQGHPCPMDTYLEQNQFCGNPSKLFPWKWQFIILTNGKLDVDKSDPKLSSYHLFRWNFHTEQICSN